MTIPEYPHVETIDSLVQKMEVSKEGLRGETAEENLSIYGPNEIQEKKHSLFILFLTQFKSPLIYVLLVAAILSFFLQNLHEGLLILLIILVNALIGFWQEVKALSSIRSLKKLTESRTQVRRDDQIVSLPSSALVPGDVILLSEGDIVPADIRLFDTNGLVIDESILTGESVPVQKDANLTLPKETLPYELDNMALSGTTVTKGNAEGFAVFTGHETYLASIAGKAEEESPETPLTRALEVFIKKHMLILFVLILLTAVLAFRQGREVIEIIYLIIAE